MKKKPPDKPSDNAILLKIPDQDYTYATHAIDNFPQCQPQICHLDTLDACPSTLTKINDFHHIKTEPTIETSKSKGLWFVPVKLHDPEDVATQAMVDTGAPSHASETRRGRTSIKILMPHMTWNSPKVQEQ